MPRTPIPSLPHRAPVASYVGGAALSVVAGLLIGYLLLRPPMADLAQLAAQLVATAVVSLIVGYAAYRGRWIDRSPRLAYTLLGSYVLATAITLFNIWVSARLMFLNEHDLLLGTSLLVFAGGIAIAFGGFYADAITARLDDLRTFAAEIAHGHLATRMTVSGRDEVADVAHSLNTMATQLEEGQRRQQDLEVMRRELLAWVGHDLRAPLASVQAIVEALADGVVEDPVTTKRYLRTAQHNIQALSGLIDDLFELSQIEAGRLVLNRQPSSMSDLVSDTIESYSALASAGGVRLTGAAEPAVDPITIDAERVGRVLTNLISNAIRHTSEGGQVQVRAVRNDKGVRVSVTDTGEGMGAEQVDRVFDRFSPGTHSPGRRSGRSGLGLAIARGIIEAHGGQIALDSTLGVGTRAYIQLPAGQDIGSPTA